MASLPLTDHDLRMLGLLFGEAHRRGHMNDEDYERTIVIRRAARVHRDRHEEAMLGAGV